MSQILVLLLVVVAFLISITIHEFFHAYCAYLLGDSTAKDAGRLTLNPIAHIDPLGLVFLIIARIGWAKPVPIDPKNFQYPRLYSIVVGFAGPLSNFAIALIALYILTYSSYLSTHELFKMFLKQLVTINIMLGVFNSLPIPPLDGGHIIGALVPERFKPAYYKLQIVFLIILFVLFSMPFFQSFFIKTMHAVELFLRKLVI